jgi:hypothetical protein
LILTKTQIAGARHEDNGAVVEKEQRRPLYKYGNHAERVCGRSPKSVKEALD